MKKVRYGIGFFCAVAVLAWGYGKSFHLSEEKRQKELIEQKIQQSEGKRIKSNNGCIFRIGRKKG